MLTYKEITEILKMVDASECEESDVTHQELESVLHRLRRQQLQTVFQPTQLQLVKVSCHHLRRVRPEQMYTVQKF